MKIQAQLTAHTYRKPSFPAFCVLAGKRSLFLLFFAFCIALSFGSSSALAARITMVSAQPAGQELSDAKKALQNGEIVAMQNVKPEVFSGRFNVGLAKSRKASDVGGSYCVIGAGYDQKHILHTYRGELVQPGNSDADCMTRFQKWADKLNTLRPGTEAALAAAVGDAPGIGPSSDAWTALIVNTDSDADTSGNELQVTYSIYRANSTFASTDWYVIVQETITSPHFDNCGEFSPCGWYSSGATYQISATDLSGNVFPLFEREPQQSNGSSTTSFSVGGGISGLGGDISASFGESYSQLNVTTVDTTSPTTNIASWNNIFDDPGSWPHYGDPPPAVKGPWTSVQSAIFSVPVGTSAFNILINDQANYDYNALTKINHKSTQVADTITVYPPSLSASPSVLRLAPGQSANLNVSAIIQGFGAGQLSWTITNHDTNNNINISPPNGAGTQDVTISVPSTATTTGPTIYLDLDTAQSYASAQTKNGPIEIPITVVSPSTIAPGVLLTGGVDWTGSPVNTAEIWSPSTQTSTAVGNMLYYRAYQTATPVINDRVLIAGGLDNDFIPVQPTELYDETSQTFVPGPDLQVARASHTATLLNDGTVLIAGGESQNSTVGTATATAEIYDPVANKTTSVGNMTTARMNHTASLMSTGDVLICGGSATLPGAGISSCEIYYPDQQKFVAVDSTGLSGIIPYGSASLTSGQVVLLGDSAPATPSDANALFTPSSNTFTSFPENGASANGGLGLAMLSLPAGGVLSAGGAVSVGGPNSPQISNIWIPQLESFVLGGSMVEYRTNPAAVYLQNTGTGLDGKIAVMGGVPANSGASGGTAVEVETLGTGISPFSPAGSLTTPRSYTTATLVIAPVTPTLNLTSSSNPAAVGTNITFTASPSASGRNSTGTVAFTVDGNPTPVATVSLLNGSATYSTSILAIGNHTITAAYSGGVGLESTSASVTQTINPNPVASVFSNIVIPQAVNYGTPSVALQGTVSGTSGTSTIYPSTSESVSINIGAASVSVGFQANGNLPSPTNFSLSTTAGPLDAGNYTISYSYSGDTLLKPAKAQTPNFIINALNPTLRPAAIQPINAGTNLSVSGTVASGNYYPTGNVTINVYPGTATSGAPAATGPVAIQANGSFNGPVTTSALAPGNYTVVYISDASTNFLSATAQASLTVNPLTTTTTLMANLANWFVGQPVTFTSTVTNTSGTGGTPTGTVAFMNGSITLGTAALNNGVATYTVVFPTAVQYSVTAVYGNNPPFTGSTSTIVQQTVSKNTAAFNGLSASQTVPYGTQSIALAGKVWAPNGPAGVAATTTEGSTDGSVGVYFTGLNATGISTDAATFSVWINTTIKGQQMILQTSAVKPAVYLENDQISIAYPGESWTSTDTTPVSDGLWHHIAVSFDQGKITIYKDGVATQDSFTVPSPIASDDTVNFGGGGVYTQIPSFNGQMWNAQEWASASSASDIQAQMFPNYNGVYPAALRVLSSFDSNAGTATNLIDGSSARVKEVTMASVTLPFQGQYPATTEQMGIALETNGGVTIPVTNPYFGINGSFSANVPVSSAAAGVYTITYTYNGNAALMPYSYNGTTLTINAQPTFTVSSPAPVGYYTPTIDLSGTLTVAGGTIPASETITLQIPGVPQQQTTTTAGGGFTFKSVPIQTLSANTYTITYSFAGDSNFGPASNSKTSLTISKITPNITKVVVAPSSIPAGPGSVSITGLVSQSGAIPTGYVQAKINGITGSQFGLASDGTFKINYNTSALPGSSTPYTVEVDYLGDTNFNTQGDFSGRLTVNKATSSTSLTSLPNPSTVGQQVIFTATVSGTGNTPTGTVNFFDGTTNIGSGTISGNVATLKLSTLAAGSHTITANYGGDNNFASSPSNVVTQVVKAVSTTVLASLQNPSTVGQLVTFTATVSGSGNTPTGTVNFFDGTTNIGSQTLSGGVATLKVSTLTAGPHTITATYDGDNNFASSPSNVVTQVVKAVSTTVLASLQNPSTVGQQVTFTATVSGSGNTPTGTVNFFDGTTNIGSGTISAGVATLKISTLTAGSHSITAQYGGDSNFATSPSNAVTQVVKAASTTVLASLQNPSTVGQQVTFTATVSGSGNAPTGTVNFFDGTTNIGSGTISAGVATLKTSTLAAGSHSITAQYGGDSNFGTSTSNTVTQVVKAASTTVLASLQNPSTVGQQVTFTATVSGTGNTPTGTVNFFDGTTNIGSQTLSAGVATLKTSTLAAGSHTITAQYGGDSNFGTSTSNTVTQVVKAASTTVLASLQNPSTVGQQVTFTATVSGTGNTPTGTVNFFDGTTNIGSQTLSGGVATLKISTLAAGSHSITAQYGGDSNFASSPSNVVTQVVKAASTTVLASLQNPSTVGQQVTFTATVSGTGNTPTGTVNFFDGTTNIGSGTISAGVATLKTSTLAAGSHTITATYGGDSNFATSTSNTVTQVVKAASTTVLASLQNPSTVGQQVTFTATVSGTGNTPTGTVNFFDGTTNIGSGTISAGVATLKTSTLAAGSHTITATYGGDSNFATSPSNAVTQQVNPAVTATVITVTATPNPADYGATVTFNATVTTQDGSPVPIGYVIISEPLGPGNVPNYGTGNLDSNGKATVVWDPSTNGQTNTLTPGIHSISVNYGGGQPIYPDSHIDGYQLCIIGNGSTCNPGGGLTGDEDQFDFSGGFAAAKGQLQLNGSAELDGSKLQLTDGDQNQAGSAFYATPVNVQSFTTDFAFQMSEAEADGLTFTIQNVGPKALGAVGGSLGYAGIGRSVAIKFDIFNNAGEGDDSTGLFINGEQPGLPSVDLTGSRIDLSSGHSIQAHITYDGTDLKMTLTDTVTKVAWTHTFTVNIPAIVSGSTAYVGFTGGTGGLTANQEISSWTFASGNPPALDYGNGFTSKGLVFNGSAELDGSRLQLTDGDQNQAGSAFYATPVNVQSFTTDFAFQLSEAEADGLTFTIQNAGTKALGSTGGSLGYAGIGKSVAIKFDIYNNAGEGDNSTGLFINGEQPGLPSVDLTNARIDLSSGHSIQAHVTYEGSTLNLTLTDTVTNATWSHAFTVNIPAIVDGSTAYVGFTGATGGLTAEQEISSWTFTGGN
jgi:Bacterial Ig-like domain (group 3)/Bacterial lectin/Concanavalin A-like lectin/glucanases superfamily/Galactose oxidase, central domain